MHYEIGFQLNNLTINRFHEVSKWVAPICGFICEFICGNLREIFWHYLFPADRADKFADKAQILRRLFKILRKTNNYILSD